MGVSFSKLLAGALCAGAIVSLAYTALAIVRVRKFRELPGPEASQDLPAISVFKPLHGEEPELYENLRSFCDQAYPAPYQILFGAADPQDPALAVARHLQREFPGVDITVITGSKAVARNPKIGNLLGMWEHVKHGVLVIADSDIRAGRDYLRAVAAGFDDPETGAVTCLYGGVPSDATVASALGAMFVNDQFAPSALVAQAMEPLTYCFGATMAVRRDVLDAIGGLAALGDNLGDDYMLGNLVSRAGKRVVLSPYIVQTSVNERTLRALWLHELRWARTILAARPLGYAGSIVTYALPFAFAYAYTARNAAGLAMLLAASVARSVLHFEARRTFAPQTPARPLLIPLRDALGVAIWAASFFGKRVRWRTGQYRLDVGGRMAARKHEM